MSRSVIAVLFAGASLAHAALLPDFYEKQAKADPQTVAAPDPQLFEEYGFDQAERGTYGPMTVTAWRFRDTTGAIAGFQYLRPVAAKASDLAKIAAATATELITAQGNYVLEFTGRIPTTELKQELIAKHVLGKGEAPRLLVGDNIQLAIGQGLLAATPLQLANAYSTIANGGYLNRPLIIRAIYQGGTPDGQPGYANLGEGVLLQSFDKAEVIHQIPMPQDEIRGPIIEGLTRVIEGPGVTTGAPGHEFLHRSTGELLFNASGYPWQEWPIAGKTGTAQGSQSKPWFDSSVFASFTLPPADAPADAAATQPYTVVSYLEKAGYGAKASGPVVKCMMEMLAGKLTVDPVVMSEPLNQAVLYPALPSKPLDDIGCLHSIADGLRD